MTIDSDPAEAIKHAQLEYLNALHWGDKDSRMVFWAKGCNIDGIPGLGIVSNSSPDPEQWVWRAYLVMHQKVDAQMAELLAAASALRIAKEKCEELGESERPSKVVVYSSSNDALVRIQEGKYIFYGDARMPKAGVKIVERGLVAAHLLRKLGIEVKLRWAPEGFEIDGLDEVNYAASEGAKYIPPAKGPDAFIKDIQGNYERREKAKARRKERKLRKKREKEATKRARGTAS
jgi:hypothetical protein